MTIKDRKEREKEEKRNLILNAARELIKEEGIEQVTVRKIADKIEYSAPIIYHYFKDKDEIIDCLMKEGYMKILGSLSIMKEFEDNPIKKLEMGLRNYISKALEMSDEYKAVLLNEAPNIVNTTSVLFKGASKERKALGLLCECISSIYSNKRYDDDFIELTAQTVWMSTFGLIIRLIIEKSICGEQRERLINHHIASILTILNQ